MVGYQGRCIEGCIISCHKPVTYRNAQRLGSVGNGSCLQFWELRAPQPMQHINDNTGEMHQHQERMHHRILKWPLLCLPDASSG